MMYVAHKYGARVLNITRILGPNDMYAQSVSGWEERIWPGTTRPATAEEIEDFKAGSPAYLRNQKRRKL